MAETVRTDVSGTADVEEARRRARQLSRELGFDAMGAEYVVLAVSELGTNLVRYARGGVLEVTPLARPGAVGVQLVSLDRGPGIGDLELAMTDGFSTGGGLGGGLPAVRRLMDEFEIESHPGGTRVTARKWIRNP